MIPLGAALVGIAMGAFTLNFAGKARRLIRSVALVGLCLSSASMVFGAMAGLGALLIGFP